MNWTEMIALPLLGGALIGLASAAMMFFQGRIAGISGIVGGALTTGSDDKAWRAAFIGGLLAGGALLMVLYPTAFPTSIDISVPATVAAGLLVGFGTRLGSGCTSGHGVCGISRFSIRSILATMTFMAAGMITVFIVRVFFGGA